MQHPITKELLLAYFANKATPTQKQAIESWRTENPECFYLALHRWELQYPSYWADLPSALHQFRQRIYPPDHGEQ